jgi:hypothetical protein
MHYLSGNNLSLDGIKIDKQPSDDYIMVSGTYGEVSWANKSLFIDPTPFEHYVGELYGGGVITDIWREAGEERFLIMSPQVCSYVNGGVLYKTNFNISNVQNALSGASWSSYGLSNSVIYSLQPGYNANVLTNGVAAALNYVNNDFGTGVFNDWFVPSFTELMTMVDNSNIINNSLSLLADTWGNSLLSNSGIIPAKIDYIKIDNYISSTEVSSDMLLNLGILTSDGVDIGPKSSSGLIRPFRVGNDYIPPVFGLTWQQSTNVTSAAGCTETFPGSGTASGWKISNNNRNIRFDVSRSTQCNIAPIGTCIDKQDGYATASIIVKERPVWMTLDFDGLGELVSSDYDKIFFVLDGVVIAKANAPGSNVVNSCDDGPVIKTFYNISGQGGTVPSANSTNPYTYPLAANTPHILGVSFSTNDGLFHRNSYYEARIDFKYEP